MKNNYFIVIYRELIFNLKFKMKKNNTKLKIDILKIKSLYDDISIYRSNSTIKKYINQRLKGMNIEKKNNNINKSLNNKRILYTANKSNSNKRKTNFQHTNTSSSTSISEKSAFKDLSREINTINLIAFENDISNEKKEDNLKEKEKELEMIKEENEILKIKLKQSQKKVSNLEDILKNILENSKPKNKRECPIPTPAIIKYPHIIVRRKKRKKITKYTRGDDDEEFNINNDEYYYNICKTEEDR